MNEDKIIKQIIASNMKFHPNIENSDLDLNDKIALQYLLKTEFNGDFRALIEDMMKHSIEHEEYETAAIIRDQLKHIEND